MSAVPKDFFEDADELAARLFGTDQVSTIPQILISTDLDGMTQSAIHALCRDWYTYQRGGALVHIAAVDADERRKLLPTGTPIIRGMSRATLRVRLSEAAEWRRAAPPKPGAPPAFFDTRPDEHVVGAVLEAGSWPGMRVLIGVSETPLLRRDGEIVQQPGYDADTGFVFVPSTEYPPIEQEPTPEEGQQAYAELRDLFSDFEFSSPEGNALPIAAILTIVARSAIDGSVPAFLIEAAVRGAGKTLCSDVISMVATGRCASRTTFPEEDEELSKVLSGYALQGAALISLDNVSRPFGGSALDAFLTARDSVDVRTLGQTGQRTVPWIATILATGNNIQIRGDTGRRVLFSRLEPKCERPEDRTGFAHPDLVGFARENRARLVVAALTVLRSYVCAGRPTTIDGTWGSFEGWTSLVPSAIVFAGGPNVLKARLGAGDDMRDTELGAIRTLLAGMTMLCRNGGMKARDVVHVLWPKSGRDPETPDGYDDLRDAIETLTRAKSGRAPTSKQLSDVFRAMRGRWIDGRRIVDEGGEKGTAKWIVEAAG